MDSDQLAFLKALATEKMSNVDRAVALLWWRGKFDSDEQLTASDLANDLKNAGYPAQNVSRLNGQLKKDSRTAKSGPSGYRIRLNRVSELDDLFREFASRKTVVASDSVLPKQLFVGTRGYIEKVVQQINASFDCGLHDCCAVMCRRLLETLVIEVYEHQERGADLHGPDGNFMMFSGLLSKIESDPKASLSRNGLKGLKDFKKLGDLSAHNRRFNARKTDVERIRDGLRVAVEELLHMAKLVS